MKSALLAVLTMCLLAGCVTNPDGSQSLSDGGKEALKQVAVIGMTRHLRENADSAKAQRIRGVLIELQALPDITTVDGLKAAVQLRIDTKVGDPGDRRDFTDLLQILAPLLQEYVGRGALEPDQVVKLRDFLGYLAAAIPE